MLSYLSTLLVPIAYFVCKYQEKLLRGRYFYLSGFVFFSIIDYWLSRKGIYVGTYARNAVLFGSLALFSFIYLWSLQKRLDRTVFQEGKLAELIHFVSKNAFGIFALQRYWQLVFSLLFQQLFTTFRIPETFSVSTLQINLLNPIVGIAVVLSCIGSVRFLRSTPLKGFV